MVESASSPTARALQALLLLQDHPGITATRLGERLDVSERAARRYVGLLRAAGVPVVAERGPYGGYRLGHGLRLPPLTFTATEALGLVMAVLDGHHAAGDATDPVGAALAKIIRALPAAVAAQADAVRRSAAAVPDRGAARPDPATTTALVEACSAARRVRLGYRTESGRAWDRVVDPWAVVVRHGRWYLLCLDHDAAQGAGEPRAYRIDRITGATRLEAEAVVPADLDPVAALESHLASGWDHAAEVVIEVPLERAQRCLPRSIGRLEAAGPHSCRLIGSTGNPHWYAEQLVLVPGRFRVVGCDHLRQAVAGLAERLAAAVD